MERATASLAALALSVALAHPAAARMAPTEDSNSQPSNAPARDGTPTAAEKTGIAQPQAVKPINPVDEVVVHGIRRGELILPTQVTSGSAFGLDLDVLQTPRNTTILSHAQLDAINVQNPQEFSYLTSSSYSDASFGVPNVPRVRGQYADVFFNGMRDSFTSNGYGAPISFNSIDTLDIVKGPASVQAGPGQGVGGAIDIATKRPGAYGFDGSASALFDNNGRRRWDVDLSGPISDKVALRVSYTGEASDSYYRKQFFDQQAVYVSLLAKPNDRYTLQLDSEAVYERYKEFDGINRVNQQLIDSGLYLSGGAITPISAFGTQTLLGPAVPINGRVNIEETSGTLARANKFNFQIIQTYRASQNLSIVNNTFFNYLDRFNEVQTYFADDSRGSYTIENKTDLKYNFSFSLFGRPISNQVDGGITFRYAHVDTIQNFLSEPVSVYDLSGDPSQWRFPSDLQAGSGAFLYKAPFGRIQYGVPGREAFALNASSISDLSDGAAFLEHRLQFSDQLSLLYGLRLDAIHASDTDPLEGDVYEGLPKTVSSPWYGLVNANVSPVYQFAPWGSAYFTYNVAQYTFPNGNDGGVGIFGINPATVLRQDTHLYEGGVKFSLLDKSLFISTAIYNQSRAIPTGPGGTQESLAHIKGAEFELNYQPNRKLFATASYSYNETKLDTPASFYNYPAEPGVNNDGAGLLAVFAPGQKFDDPGIPHHLFNFLANYHLTNAVGVQTSLQVTSPIDTTTSGQLDLAASSLVPDSVVANHGYYNSPVIPWQYTLNAAVFYDLGGSQLKLSIYNLSNQRNYVNAYPFYGNDFITRVVPITFEVSIKAKFH